VAWILVLAITLQKLHVCGAPGVSGTLVIVVVSVGRGIVHDGSSRHQQEEIFVRLRQLLRPALVHDHAYQDLTAVGPTGVSGTRARLPAAEAGKVEGAL